MRGDDDLAAVVRAYSFQLVSPDTGQVIAELVEDFGVPILKMGDVAGNPSAMFMAPTFLSLEAPTGSWGNPPQVQLLTDAQALLFSGGGLGIAFSEVAAFHDGPAGDAYSLLTADSGGGVVATVRARSLAGVGSVTAAAATVAITGTTSVTVTGPTINLAPSNSLLLNATKAALVLSQSYENPQTANVAMGAAYAVLTGCSRTVAGLNTGDIVIIEGTFDFGNAGAISDCAGNLFVDGVLDASHGVYSVIGAGGRATHHTQWRHVPTAASHTYSLRAKQGGGTWTAYTTFGGVGGGNMNITVMSRR